MRNLDTPEAIIQDLLRQLTTISTAHDPIPFQTFIAQIASNSDQIELITQALEIAPFDTQTKRLVVLLLAKVLQRCELGNVRQMEYYLRLMFSWNLAKGHKQLLKKGMLSLMATNGQIRGEEQLLQGLYDGCMECLESLIQQIGNQGSQKQYRSSDLPPSLNQLILCIAHPDETSTAIETFLLMSTWRIESTQLTYQMEQFSPRFILKGLVAIRRLMFASLVQVDLFGCIQAMNELCSFYLTLLQKSGQFGSGLQALALESFEQWETVAQDISLIYQLGGELGQQQGIWDYLGAHNNQYFNELVTLKSKAAELHYLCLFKIRELPLNLHSIPSELSASMPHFYQTIANYLVRTNRKPTDQAIDLIGYLTLIMSIYVERENIEVNLTLKMMAHLVVPLLEWAFELAEDYCESGSALLSTLQEGQDSTDNASLLESVSKLTSKLFDQNRILFTYLLDCLQLSLNQLLDLSLPKTSAIINNQLAQIPLLGLRQLFFISASVSFLDDHFYEQLCAIIKHYMMDKKLLERLPLGQKHYLYFLLSQLWSGFEERAHDDLTGIFHSIIASDCQSQTLQAFKVDLVRVIFEDTCNVSHALLFLAHLHKFKAQDVMDAKWSLVSLLVLNFTSEYSSQELAIVASLMKTGMQNELSTMLQHNASQTINPTGEYKHYASICKSLANRTQKFKNHSVTIIVLLSFCQLLESAASIGLDRGIGQVLCGLTPILENQWNSMKQYFNATLEEVLRVLQKMEFRGDLMVLFVLKYMNAMVTNRADPPMNIHQAIIDNYSCFLSKGSFSTTDELNRSWKGLMLVQIKFLTFFGGKISLQLWDEHQSCYFRLRQFLEHSEEQYDSQGPTHLRLLGQLKVIEILLDQRLGRKIDYTSLNICSSLRIFSQCNIYQILLFLSADIDKETALSVLDTAICLVAHQTYHNTILYSNDQIRDPLQTTHKTIDQFIFKDTLAIQVSNILKRCSQLYRESGIDINSIVAGDKLNYVRRCQETTIYLDFIALKIEKERLKEISQELIKNYYTEELLLQGRNPELERKIIKVAGVRSQPHSIPFSQQQVPPKRNRYDSSSDSDNESEQEVSKKRTRGFKKVHLVEKMFERQMYVSSNEVYTKIEDTRSGPMHV